MHCLSLSFLHLSTARDFDYACISYFTPFLKSLSISFFIIFKWYNLFFNFFFNFDFCFFLFVWVKWKFFIEIEFAEYGLCWKKMMICKQWLAIRDGRGLVTQIAPTKSRSRKIYIKWRKKKKKRLSGYFVCNHEKVWIEEAPLRNVSVCVKKAA